MRTSIQTQVDLARIGFVLWLGAVRRFGLPRASVVALVVVLALATGATVAQASPGFSRGARVADYYGLTAQDSPLLIETSKDGRVIKRAIGTLDLGCTGAPTGPVTMSVKDGWEDVVVALSGSFKQSFNDSQALPSGGTVEETAEFNGRFDRKRAVVKGTWRLQIVAHDPDGSTMTCESGVQRFTARRMQG